MPIPIQIELYRALWKFCFRLNNADTIANRKINLDTLAILFNHNAAVFRQAVDGDRAFYSSVGPDADPLDALVEFLSHHPDLYSSLDPAAHVLIDGRLEADINNLAQAHFTASDMASHVASLQAQDASVLAGMTSDVWGTLLADAEEEGLIDEAVRLATSIYGQSPGYDAADQRFTRFVEPALPKFTAVTMDEMLAKIEENSQTYGRGRASVDHPQVKEAADALGVDTTKYKRFTKYL